MTGTRTLSLTLSSTCVLNNALREWRRVAPDLITQDPIAYQRWIDERVAHSADLVAFDNMLTDCLAARAGEHTPEHAVVLTLSLTPSQQALIQAALREWRITPPMEIRSDAGRLGRWLDLRELHEDTLTALQQQLDRL